MRFDRVSTEVRVARAERPAIRPRQAPRVQCPCCSLLTAYEDTFQWRETKTCKRLAVLGAEDLDDSEGWISGVYRYYQRTDTHRVCWTCYEYLMAGGDIESIARNRAKLAFVVLLAIVALLIATLPLTLPTVLSALWLN